MLKLKIIVSMLAVAGMTIFFFGRHIPHDGFVRRLCSSGAAYVNIPNI